MGVKQEDHDALLVEVQRLELELAGIRQDLQGVVGCKGKCEQLDTLQETVSNTNIDSCFAVIHLCIPVYSLDSCVSFSKISAQVSAQVSSQVRKELQALFFGSGEPGVVPESLILWLSQRYVTTPDLHASLSSMELSILRNVSQQLELNRAQTLGEAESQAQTIVKTVTGTVQHAAAAEGLTEEVMSIHDYSSIAVLSSVQMCVCNVFEAHISFLNSCDVFSIQASKVDRPKRFEALLPGSNRPGGLRPGVWR